MKLNYREFKKDQFFFFKYFLGQMFISVVILYGIFLLRGPLSFDFDFSNWHFLTIPVAMIIGVQAPALLHNAVHFNLRPLWLNDLIGEALGFFVLFGLGPFRISHFLHHAHADSIADPHPPNGRSFFHFLATTQVNTIMVIRRRFLDIHGDTMKSHSILAAEMFFYYVSLVVRPLCWFWLLGPTWFVCFYLPAYIVNVLVFAHINFATHETMKDGSVEITNLNGNTYYRFINFIGSGVYFHKNHHAKPTLFNPAELGRL